jgi:acetyltransferase-like isoleucine patch superfamily enzyme
VVSLQQETDLSTSLVEASLYPKECATAKFVMRGFLPELLGKVRISITGKGHTILIDQNVTLKNLHIQIMGNDSLVYIGPDSTVKGILRCAVSGNIFIAGGLQTNGNPRIHASAGKTIYIGKGCLFANPAFRTCDSHSIIDLTTNTRINPEQDIIVNDRVWIAEDVKVYKGAVIGEGSIVGANSVVSRAIPSNVLAVGAPAKAIKENVSWLKERV